MINHSVPLHTIRTASRSPVMSYVVSPLMFSEAFGSKVRVLEADVLTNVTTYFFALVTAGK